SLGKHDRPARRPFIRIVAAPAGTNGLPRAQPRPLSIVHDFSAFGRDRQHRIAKPLLTQVSLTDERMNHRSNLALGHGAQAAKSWQLLMIVSPDLYRIGARNQVGQLAAAESSFKPC